MEKGLTERIIAGDVRAAAKLMRGIEDDMPEATHELTRLYGHTGNAFIVGVTGAPGVGKSTLVGALITGFRKRGATVGVVAIDPTSPFTGGALLGDRIRMGVHSTDKGVFIRSVASRGWAGGLARAAGRIIHVLDAMGKEVILVEAVGSGQGEVDIHNMSDTTIAVLSPGAGDEIQMMKAGMLEAADIFIVNKSDKEGAENIKVQLELMLGMGVTQNNCWKPDIVMTEAVSGKGIEDAVDAILKHKEYLKSTGETKTRRQARARMELLDAIEHSLQQKIKELVDESKLKSLLDDIARRQLNPYSVAEELVERVAGHSNDCE